MRLARVFGLNGGCLNGGWRLSGLRFGSGQRTMLERIEEVHFILENAELESSHAILYQVCDRREGTSVIPKPNVDDVVFLINLPGLTQFI